MKHLHALSGCLILLCLLCSCQAFPMSTGTTSQATAKVKPTPILPEFMQNSLKAMSNLKSFHVSDGSGIKLIVNQNPGPTPTALKSDRTYSF